MNQTKTSFSTRILAEIVIFVALATALSFIILFALPEGGSVTAGSMVPILWLALRRGPKIGLFTGAVYGMVQLAVMPQVYYPAQVLLDYPLAFGCLGLGRILPETTYNRRSHQHQRTFRDAFHLRRALLRVIRAPRNEPDSLLSTLQRELLIPEIAISAFIIYLLEKSHALRSYM